MVEDETIEDRKRSFRSMGHGSPLFRGICPFYDGVFRPHLYELRSHLYLETGGIKP